ncbi:MAG: SsgA family sporulation/cell division regulator [Frankiales bacterium]|nr:SsgA family sporulation/cell division regulator [Frankiales bacterium]
MGRLGGCPGNLTLTRSTHEEGIVEGQITAHVVVDDAGMSGHGHMTVLGLAWRDDDPLAVRISLDAQPDHPALPRGEWVVLRDFLRYGLEEPTGDGAVRIRPGDDDRVVLELIGGVKPYAVHAPAALIAEFLDATEAIVPAGAEADDTVIDALISRLLDY